MAGGGWRISSMALTFVGSLSIALSKESSLPMESNSSLAFDAGTQCLRGHTPAGKTLIMNQRHPSTIPLRPLASPLSTSLAFQLDHQGEDTALASSSLRPASVHHRG